MDSIVVMMSTFNGSEYIQEQIESILKQKKVNVKLIVRDDGSQDETISILKKYQEKNLLKYFEGNNIKTAKSFMELVMKAEDSPFYAFSDQDDIWNEDKLYRAIVKIKETKNFLKKPVVYASDYQLVDSLMRNIKDYNHITTTSFGASIAYSSCTGCTMVFNRYLMERLKGKMPGNLIMHDDWVHKVCLALGGEVLFDNVKTMRYRQHAHNVEGEKHSIIDKLQRVWSHFRGVKRNEFSKQLLEILKFYKKEMPPENIILVNNVLNYKNKNLLERILLASNKNYETPTKNLKHEFQLYIILKCW